MNIEPIEYNGDIAIGLILRAKPGYDLNKDYLYEVMEIYTLKLRAIWHIVTNSEIKMDYTHRTDIKFEQWDVVGFSSNYISPITKINCILPLSNTETTKKKSRLSFI